MQSSYYFIKILEYLETNFWLSNHDVKMEKLEKKFVYLF